MPLPALEDGQVSEHRIIGQEMVQFQASASAGASLTQFPAAATAMIEDHVWGTFQCQPLHFLHRDQL